MQKISVIATGRFVGHSEGSVTRGQRLLVTEQRANELASLGLIERLPVAPETKPAPFALETKPFSPPPAQVSEPMTSNIAEEKPSSSASMTPGGSHHGPMPSTPATELGGDTTSQLSEQGSAARSGRKTRRRRQNTD